MVVIVDFRVTNQQDSYFLSPAYRRLWDWALLMKELEELELEGHFIIQLLDKDADDWAEGRFALSRVETDICGRRGGRSPLCLAKEAVAVCGESGQKNLVLRPMAGQITKERIESIRGHDTGRTVVVSACAIHDNANPYWTLPVSEPSLRKRGSGQIVVPADMESQRSGPSFVGSHALPSIAMVDGAIVLFPVLGADDGADVRYVFCPAGKKSMLHTLLMREGADV